MNTLDQVMNTGDVAANPMQGFTETVLHLTETVQEAATLLTSEAQKLANHEHIMADADSPGHFRMGLGFEYDPKTKRHNVVGSFSFEQEMGKMEGRIGESMTALEERVMDQSSVRTYAYADRGQLRNVTKAKPGDVAVVETLGMYVFSSDSDEPDDDETAFTASTVGGVWLLQAVSLDTVCRYLWSEFTPQTWVEMVEVRPTVTTLAAGATVTIQVDGLVGIAGGEKMLVVPPPGASPLLLCRAYSNYWRRVLLQLTNPTVGPLAVDSETVWRVCVLRVEEDYGA